MSGTPASVFDPGGLASDHQRGSQGESILGKKWAGSAGVRPDFMASGSPDHDRCIGQWQFFPNPSLPIPGSIPLMRPADITRRVGWVCWPAISTRWASPPTLPEGQNKKISLFVHFCVYFFAAGVYYYIGALSMRDFQPRRRPSGVASGLLHAGAERYAAPPRISNRIRQHLANSRKWPNRSGTIGHFRALSGIKMGKMGNLIFVFGSISPTLQNKALRPTPPLRAFRAFCQQPRAIEDASPAVTIVYTKNIELLNTNVTERVTRAATRAKDQQKTGQQEDKEDQQAQEDEVIFQTQGGVAGAGWRWERRLGCAGRGSAAARSTVLPRREGGQMGQGIRGWIQGNPR